MFQRFMWLEFDRFFHQISISSAIPLILMGVAFAATFLAILLSIPFAALSVPWLYYGAKLSILTDSTNQPLNNLCFGVLSSHGTASSLTLLLLTDPYRRFIESLLRKLPYGEKLMKLFTKQQHVVSVSITQ
ncbi:unnamed protein product, partial [Mesorhabditis belari]|uniref:Uncharacterized protein n=1 Tax=Mesorhabditis belari TaxID=2138241 RepID=A0AAF3EJR0_9BILA